MEMDWITGIQNAIDYVEAHIDEPIDYESAARCAYSSSFHFQRVFGILCGMTLGEYIRKRRLTLAGKELLGGKTKVIDVALKYGYESPESFTRAFLKFHGVNPSQVKIGCSLKSFSRISVKSQLTGGDEVHYKIEKRPELILTGYKKRFSGVPFGEERARQEETFIRSTRALQWLLIGASANYEIDYCVIADEDDAGYDFYIAYELDEWTRGVLFDPRVTGVDFMDSLELETIRIPEQTYAIFETKKMKRPIRDYIDLRRKISLERPLSENKKYSRFSEVVIMHWRPKGEWEKERFIEICLPVG